MGVWVGCWVGGCGEGWDECVKQCFLLWVFFSGQNKHVFTMSRALHGKYVTWCFAPSQPYNKRVLQRSMTLARAT